MWFSLPPWHTEHTKAPRLHVTSCYQVYPYDVIIIMSQLHDLWTESDINPENWHNPEAPWWSTLLTLTNESKSLMLSLTIGREGRSKGYSVGIWGESEQASLHCKGWPKLKTSENDYSGLDEIILSLLYYFSGIQKRMKFKSLQKVW